MYTNRNNIFLDPDDDKAPLILTRLELHYHNLYKFAIRKVSDKDTALDLVQDTYLAAIEAWESFEQRSSDRSWLTAILKNKINRVYRTSQTSKLLTSKPKIDSFNTSESQLDKIIQDEFLILVNQYIATLPLKWQEIYCLRYVNDEPTAEICRKLDLTPENYYVISHRLKAALKKWYRDAWLAD